VTDAIEDALEAFSEASHRRGQLFVDAIRSPGNLAAADDALALLGEAARRLRDIREAPRGDRQRLIDDSRELAARGDAVTVYARGGNDYAAPVVPSRGKARPSAYANSAAKKRRRRRARGW